MSEKRKSLKLKNVRCMYPTLATPKAFEGQAEDSAKYSIQVLIPKSDKVQIQKIKDFVKDSIDSVQTWNAAVKKRVLKKAFDTDPSNKFCVLKDGDLLNAKRVDEDEKEALEGYADHYVVSAKRHCKMGAPIVVDRNNQPIPSGLIMGAIVSGYWVNIAIDSYCYPKPEPGFTFSLFAVQKYKEDEVFGQSSPFESYEDEDDEDEDDNEDGAFDE